MKALMQKRTIFPLLVALGSMTLSACGFQPLYSQSVTGPTVQQHLQNVEVVTGKGRLDQMVYSDLLAKLTPLGPSAVPAYKLEVKLDDFKKGVGFEEDDSVTRFNFQLIAAYRLIDVASGKTVFSSSSRSIAAYNVVTSQYATLTAEKDAEKRASADLANDIRLQLSLHFRQF
jgi:LPS-assembly lipoprotein